MSDENKGGTRVFKKTSPNGKITTYLGKRDFIDHLTHVETIDGMILIDPDYAADGKKIYATLLAAFRYGREDLDVLGLQFRKDLFSSSMQVYPPDVTYKDKPLSRLQERLKKKLGEHAFTLQPAPGDTGKPCGVDYELNTFIAENLTEKPKKQNCVRLAIRKLTYAAFDKTRPQPSIESSKEFMMSAGLLHLEASLDKEVRKLTGPFYRSFRAKCVGLLCAEVYLTKAMYYHGESISINVHIQNNSNKSVKKLKASVLQIADICLFTTASYSCEVAKLESGEGFPVGPGSTLSKVYTLCPLLANNKDKRGLALDGKLKHEDTNLASSTIMAEGALKENLGIIVQYKVKIRLTLGGPLGGEMTAELPFTLTHPKPPESPKPTARSVSEPVVDMDLIQLDTNAEGTHLDDDIIFEDFARLRLKGADSEDHEA